MTASTTEVVASNGQTVCAKCLRGEATDMLVRGDRRSDRRWLIDSGRIRLEGVASQSMGATAAVEGQPAFDGPTPSPPQDTVMSTSVLKVATRRRRRLKWAHIDPDEQSCHRINVGPFRCRPPVSQPFASPLQVSTRTSRWLPKISAIR